MGVREVQVRRSIVFSLISGVLGFLICLPVFGQGNYEIQVYGSDTIPPGTTMVELHSNFTALGQRYTIQGVYPTYDQEHETLQITQGINDWAEVGFYIFTSEQAGHAEYSG